MPGAGVEPARPLRPADFKSAASASSATPAGSAYVLPGANESGGKRSGPRKRRSSRKAENASSSNCRAGREIRRAVRAAGLEVVRHRPGAERDLVPELGVWREQHAGRVLVVEVAQLLHRRRRHLRPVEDEDGAVLEVVHDLGDLERVRVLPVDGRRRIVRPTGRRIGVPLRVRGGIQLRAVVADLRLDGLQLAAGALHRRREIVVPAAPGEEDDAEDDRKPDQPRRRDDVEQAALPLVARAGRRRAPLRRLRLFRGVGSAIFPGHRRAIVPIRRVLTAARVGGRPTPSLAFVGPMVILALILGLLLGAACAWVVTRSRSAQLETELSLLRRAGEERAAVVAEARDAFQALSSEALRQTSSSFLEVAKTQLTGHVAPLEGLARADGPADERDGEGPPGGVRRRHAAPDHAREHAGAAAAGDGEPRQGAADAARARPLGRGAAPERGRGCRPARPLRLPGAGLDARRRGLAAPARPRRPDSGRQAGRRRRQGAARGVPGRLRGGGRRRAQPLPGRSRAPGARPPRQARPEVVLATVRAVARLRDHVRPRRDLHPRRAGAGQRAERGRLAARGHPRLPVDALHAAPHGRGDLAAGDGRAERPRGARARARAVHAARDDERPPHRRRQGARQRRQALQRGRAVAREPRARAGAPVRGPRDRGRPRLAAADRAAGDPAAGARARRARRAAARDRRSRRA